MVKKNSKLGKIAQNGGNRMKINLIHKDMTDEKCYQNIKKTYNKYPNLIIEPKEWKDKRLKELRKQGKLWST